MMSAQSESTTSHPLTSSAAASHAKMSAQQARALASAVIEAASGFTWQESSGKCSQQSLLWRMLPQELLAGLMKSGVSWQGPAMTAFRFHCRRRIAGLGICGGVSLSSLYATPQAHDTAPGDPERVGRFGTKHGGRNLNDEVAAMERGLLPTPVADDTGHRKKKYAQGGTPLSMAANLLPTPTTKGNYNKAGLSERSGDGLHTAVQKMQHPILTCDGCGNQWQGPLDQPCPQCQQIRTGSATYLPTPTVGNATGGNMTRGGERSNEPLLPGVAGGPLNPPWVEWLCGFPIGWTDCEHSETA